MATYQAISSRSAKFGKNFISVRAAGLASHSASTLGGTLMPWRCTKKQVNGDEDGDDAGQNGDVKSEEAGERGAGNLFAAAQENHHWLADDGNLAGDLRADFGGEEGQCVPGQQITAEAETHDQEEQQHAGDPGELAGLAIGLEKGHAEHVHEGGEDHQIGRPGMDGSNKPAKLHPGHDVLHALKCLVGAGAVIQQQQDAGEHLDHEQEQRDAAEEVPVGEAVRGNGLVAQRSNELFEMKPFVEPANDCWRSRLRLPLPVDDNLVAANVNIEHVERPRRRAGDIASVQVVGAVVAGTPDLAQIAAVLNRAAEMRAGGGEGPVSSIAVEDQQAGTAAEAEDLAAVRLQVASFGGHNLVSAEIDHGRRNEVAQHGIEERSQRGQDAAAEEYLNGAAARGLGLGRVFSAHLPYPLAVVARR